MKTGANTRTEVTTNAGSAHETGLRLDFSEKVDENCRMRIRCIWIKPLVGNFVKTVDSIGEHLLLNAGKVITDDNCFKFYAKTRGKHSAFGQKFEADVGHATVLKFEIYY